MLNKITLHNLHLLLIYITNLMGHDLAIIIVRNLLFTGMYGINMRVIHIFVLFDH
jgi:hypothetical protein